MTFIVRTLDKFWDSFEKLKEGLPSKGKFYNTLTNRAISVKIMNMSLAFGKLL